MTERRLYGKVRPGSPSVPSTQRDRRVEQMGGTHGGGESRAKIDTSAERLQRLGEILGSGDPDALKEWRLSQLAMLFPGREFE